MLLIPFVKEIVPGNSFEFKGCKLVFPENVDERILKVDGVEIVKN